MASIRSLTKSAGKGLKAAGHGLAVAGVAVVDADLTKPVAVVADKVSDTKEKVSEIRTGRKQFKAIKQVVEMHAHALAQQVEDAS